MERRLAYEAPSAAETDETKPVELHPDVEERLAAIEGEDSQNWRTHALKQLHDESVDRFLENPGFGVLRMRWESREDLELPEPDPIPLPDAGRSFEPYVPDDETPALEPVAAEEPLNGMRPNSNALTAFHDSGISEFLDPKRMGYAENRTRVAGFQSHQFGKMPQLSENEPHTGKWQIARLELVSLLKHEIPVAYVSPNLPRMDELDEAPARPLTAMESSALVQLRHERDIVIDNQLNTINMLGSIRAAKSCLSCHSVKRGELLGAFSYELRRLQPIQSDAKPQTETGPAT